METTPSDPDTRAVVQVMFTRKRGLDHAEAAARVLEHSRHVLADARLPDDALRRDVLDRAEEERAQLDGVDAQIEQSPTAEVQPEEAVVRLDRAPEPEIGLHEQRLADPTGPDQLDQRAVRRQEPAPDRLHEEDALATRLVHHPAGLTRVEGERLLAEHVLARSEQGEGVLHVARLRGGDVHHFDLGVFGQRGVVAIAGPNTETISEGVGVLGGPRRDG